MSKETKMAAPSSEARAMLNDFMCAFESFKDANDRRLLELESKSGEDVLTKEKVERIDQALHEQKSALDRLTLAAARPVLGGSPKPQADERKAAFESYMRKGDAGGLLEVKDLVSGELGEGGYLVPETTEREISRRLTTASPIRAISSVRQIAGASYRKPVSLGGATSGWVAETDAREETDPPTLSIIDVPAAEIYAMPAASPTLLEDSAIDVDAWLASEIEDVFAAAESKAFVTGSGTGEPKGFLSYTNDPDGTQSWGELGYIASGGAGAFASEDPADALLDLVYAPRAPYRANGRFVMNRSTVSAVRKFKDTDGDYIWKPAQSLGQEPSLFGYPVTECEDMPSIGPNTYSIAFGDFQKGYVVVDRLGVSVLRDPYSLKPYVLFYTRKRVGGAVQDFDAIKLMKFAES